MVISLSKGETMPIKPVDTEELEIDWEDVFREKGPPPPTGTNLGRELCWWCQRKTQQILLFHHWAEHCFWCNR